MSRSSTRQRTGAILAVVAFVLGVTAAAAVGWGGEQQGGQGHGKKHEKEYPPKVQEKQYPPAKTPPTEEKKPPPTEKKPPPTATTPPPVTTTPPPTTSTPPPTVTTESGPPPTTPAKPPTTTPTPPTTTAKTPTTPKAAPPLAPVAERKELASTGINPGLIAFAGVLSLIGGGLLFRRALTRS
jgi:LPXTG-motif cell wall-anchored protein